MWRDYITLFSFSARLWKPSCKKEQKATECNYITLPKYGWSGRQPEALYLFWFWKLLTVLRSCPSWTELLQSHMSALSDSFSPAHMSLPHKLSGFHMAHQFQVCVKWQDCRLNQCLIVLAYLMVFNQSEIFQKTRMLILWLICSISWL